MHSPLPATEQASKRSGDTRARRGAVTQGALSRSRRKAGGSCAATRGLSGRREPGIRATTRFAPPRAQVTRLTALARGAESLVGDPRPQHATVVLGFCRLGDLLAIRSEDAPAAVAAELPLVLARSHFRILRTQRGDLGREFD